MKIFLSVLFLLTSCGLFRPAKLSQDISKEAQNICLNNEGSGNLIVSGRSYQFRHYSNFETGQASWLLGLNFPFQAEETFEIDWSQNNKVQFKTSLDDKILKENTAVNPRDLSAFINVLGKFFKDVVKVKTNSKEKLLFKWTVIKNKLVAMDKKAVISFSERRKNSHFQKIKIETTEKRAQKYIIEFYISKCFTDQVSVKLH